AYRAAGGAAGREARLSARAALAFPLVFPGESKVRRQNAGLSAAQPRSGCYLRLPGATVKISFCIPTYNHGRFLGAALESILAQAPEDFEIVIVDGASVDETPAVVAEYQRKT